MKTAKFVLLLSLTLMLYGCGSGQSTGPDVPTGASEAIVDTHAVILESTYGGSPIKSLKDLEPYKDRFTKSYNAVKNGEVKFVWGKTVQDNVQTPEVIAYETKAESGEGWAVKNDGKIVQVTAADLPKAK